MRALRGKGTQVARHAPLKGSLLQRFRYRLNDPPGSPSLASTLDVSTLAGDDRGSFMMPPARNPHRLDVEGCRRSEGVWTVELTSADQRELDAALAHAKSVSDNLLDISRDDFPLDGLARKLEAIERELIDGRGFTRISRARSRALLRRRSDDALLGHRAASGRSLAAERQGPCDGRRHRPGQARSTIRRSAATSSDRSRSTITPTAPT